MSVVSRINELKRKHAALSNAVDQAQKSPSIDTLQIAALKKEKLALKQEIQTLSGG